MAITATAKRVINDQLKHHKLDVQSIAASGTYATGGISYENLFEGIDDPFVVIPVGDLGGYTVVQVRDTKKLKIYYSNSDAADGPLIELPDTTALPAALALIHCLVIGK